jgi:putative flavoprotein involved in K+ transport
MDACLIDHLNGPTAPSCSVKRRPDSTVPRPQTDGCSASATSERADVVVVGGGQAALATAYYLRRAGLIPGRNLFVVDAGERPGGSWQHMWKRLRLFSPSTYSSLPGWMMPAWNDARLGFPPRSHVVEYLTKYEERYELHVLRPHRVAAVRRTDIDPDGPLRVQALDLTLTARIVVSATGTWDQPFWPRYPGMSAFAGTQLHAVDYHRPQQVAGQRVVVVGGGNSAAQILAEVSLVAETTWVTTRTPRFLADDVDGRALFAAATARAKAMREGRELPGVGGLGDIVMVPSVRDARDRGVLKSLSMFTRLTTTGIVWADGSSRDADTVIWCTGFRPALRHLSPLHLREPSGRIIVDGPSGTRAAREPRVYLVGYGDWTGPASATLLGVSSSARATANEIVAQLEHRRE